MLRRLLISVSLLLAFSVSTVWAQGRFALEVGGGAAFPTDELGSASLESGAGFGFTGNVRVMPHLHLYAGWDYHHFVTDELIAGTEFDLDDTGYAFGAKFQHPLFATVGGWLKAGGVYNHIELEDEDGELIADSGHELGWEAGAGFMVPISSNVAVLPGVRYRAYSATLPLSAGDMDVDLRYLTAEIRLAFSFGAQPLVAAFNR